MTTVYLGLGSNLGDRGRLLGAARAALEAEAQIEVTGASALYETDPVGGPAGQPPFLNAVLQIETSLPPRPLLNRCLSLETLFGRERGERWGPRTLDIDLLDHGGVVLDDPELTLPHPRLAERAFVLVPLAELAPDWRHPRLGRSAAELLTALTGTDGVRLWSQLW